MVIVVTGEIGIGKTTICEKVIEIARGQGHNCGGVISCKVQNEDIVIRDVKTGETRALASTSNVYQGPHTAKYRFNPEGIAFGVQAIDRGVASDLLLVDELGHLELRGEGFTNAVEQIATGRVRNCLLVIRKELLPAFLPQLGAETSIFETTINNRNQLPGEIGLALSRAVAAEQE